jgi:hypothetical protein
MILDALLKFSDAQDLGQVEGTYDSTNILDLGLSGIPSSANGGGARDIGTGWPQMKLLAQVIEAFTSGGAATLAIALQGAPDNGSGSPGSWTTMWTSPTFALATLAVAGAQLGNIDIPRPAAGQVLPRYLKLVYTVGGATTTAGTVSAYIVLNRFDQVIDDSGALSAYPAGLTVAN